VTALSTLKPIIPGESEPILFKRSTAELLRRVILSRRARCAPAVAVVTVMNVVLAVLGGSLGCRECERRNPDCGEDLACFAAALQTCAPGVGFTQGGARTRWTIRGYVGPDCHLVAVAIGDFGAETHCSYPIDTASAWRAGAIPDPWRGKQADEACYAGDGGCAGIPVLAPLCVLGDCVAGRWTYTCELTPGGRVVQCEGTKAIDRAPADAGCWLRCEDGNPKVECYEDRRGRPMIPHPERR